MRLTALSLAGLTGLLSACQTIETTPTQNAVLTNASDETLAELTAVVSGALKGRTVTLAPDILTRRSALIIDPKYVSDRSFQKPDHFRLQSMGGNCVLRHEETEETYPLKTVQCEPLL